MPKAANDGDGLWEIFTINKNEIKVMKFIGRYNFALVDEFKRVADRACLAGSELLFPCVDSGYGKKAKARAATALTAAESGERCACKAGYANGACAYGFIAQYNTQCTVAESSASKTLGSNCSIDVNECASSPCKNGATCSDSTTDTAVSIHTYRCTCAAGYANGVCEIGRASCRERV